METEQRRVGGAARMPAYQVVAAVLLVLAAAAGWSSLILLVGGQVIPAWVVSTSLLVISLILMCVHVLRRLYAADREPLPRPGLEHCVLGLLAAAAGLGSAFGAVGDLTGGADYRVLRPTGPDGCVAVVRETSFLKISNGEVYAVGRTGVAWRPSGTWTADDMYRPVAEGTYGLRWSGSGGTFTVSGSVTDPVVASDLNALECG